MNSIFPFEPLAPALPYHRYQQTSDGPRCHVVNEQGALETVILGPLTNTASSQRCSLKIQDINRHVGQRLRDRRRLLFMNQMALGRQIGVTAQQVQKYESGVNAISVSRLQSCARALEVDINYFFEGLDAAGLSFRPSATQLLLTDLMRHFIMIPDRRHQAAICSMARALSRLN